MDGVYGGCRGRRRDHVLGRTCNRLSLVIPSALQRGNDEWREHSGRKLLGICHQTKWGGEGGEVSLSVCNFHTSVTATHCSKSIPPFVEGDEKTSASSGPNQAMRTRGSFVWTPPSLSAPRNDRRALARCRLCARTSCSDDLGQNDKEGEGAGKVFA